MGFWNWLKNKFQSAGAYIGESIDTIRGYFEDSDMWRAKDELYYVDVPDWIIERMSEPFRTIYKRQKVQAVNRANRTNKVFNNALNGLKSWWDNFSVDVSTALDGAWTQIGNIFTTLGNWGYYFKSDVATVVKGLVDFASDINNVIDDALKGMGKEAWEGLSGLADFIGDTLQGVFNTVAGAVADMTDEIMDMTDEQTTAVINEVEKWIGG